jgi:DNA-binding MarR family transcriptional regulator
MPAGQDPGGSPASLAHLLVSLARVEKRLLDGLELALSEEKASVEQWRVLRLVSQLGSPTMGELAEAADMANASLSRIVDSLEDAASVFRLPSPQDRRRIQVQVSDHGAARLARMDNVASAWESRACKMLGEENVGSLAAALEAVSEGLQTAAGGHASSIM